MKALPCPNYKDITGTIYGSNRALLNQSQKNGEMTHYRGAVAFEIILDVKIATASCDDSLDELFNRRRSSAYNGELETSTTYFLDLEQFDCLQEA